MKKYRRSNYLYISLASIKSGSKAPIGCLTLVLIILFSGTAASQQFAWAKQIAGTGSFSGCTANAMVIDSNGNIYTTGRFFGTVDFDPGPAIFNITDTGLEDIFVSKMDASGNFVWVKQMGSGGGSEGGHSIVVDNIGNVYTTGIFLGPGDFDPGPDTFNLLTAAGSLEIFISKLDSSGNFLWAKQLGGTGYDYSYSSTVDGSGNVYTTGEYTGTADFDPDTGTFYLLSGGQGENIFISKLDSAGKFVWAKQIIGSGGGMGSSITVDNNGNLYTTGWFIGTVDFDPGFATFNLTSVTTTGYDVFVSKFDTSGNFVWAKKFGGGGTNYNSSFSIAVDGSNNVYTTGGLVGTVDFDPGLAIYNLTSAGLDDIFISKLDSSGNFLWAKQIGGPNNDRGNFLTLDDSGYVYTTGFFESTVDFDPGAAADSLTAAGLWDIFIIKLDSSGNYNWAIQMGGTDDDYGSSIAIDGLDNIYSSGWFQGTGDYNPSPSIYNLYLHSYIDSYLVKLRQCLSTANTISPSVCGSYISPSSNFIWTSSGTYLDTIPNAVGCDSVITINLTINNSASVITLSACDSYTSPSGNYIWTSSGTYIDTLLNAMGCDSVITVNLTINNNASNISPTACNSYTSPSGNFLWTSSGSYQDTLPNAAGCDSVITINLTINSNDTSVTVFSGTLIANANGLGYQWLNCDSNYVAIFGATSQSYTPVVTGNYAVQISQNGCSDTSSCFNVSLSGINVISHITKIVIEPNPFSDQAILQSSYMLQNATLTVYDIFGQTIKQITGIYKQHIILHRDNLSAGIYFVRLTEGNKIISLEKLIIIDN